MQKAQGARLGLLTLLTVTRSMSGAAELHAGRLGLLERVVGWARARRR